MHQYLKYFDQPILRSSLQKALGKQQANAVIRDLDKEGLIEQRTHCEPYQLTEGGQQAWRKYVGLSK